MAWFGLGMLCAVQPRAVMVKPERHDLEPGKTGLC